MAPFFKFLAISLLLLAAPVAFAEQTPQAPSLYFVDMQRAIDQSIMGKAAKATMETEIKKRQDGLQVLKSEVERLKADLEKQASLLAPDVLEQKRDALGKKDRDLARQVSDQREELAKKNNEAIGKIVKEIDVIVKDLARKENYGFIMEKDPSYVLYLSDKYDVTDQVIKLLDKKKTES